MRHVLFVCKYNRFRSPTAEAVFADVEGIEVASAGLSLDAYVSVSTELLEWADIIFVMEKAHRTRLSDRFGPALDGKSVEVLGIPDEFHYMDPALVRVLRRRVDPLLSTLLGVWPARPIPQLSSIPPTTRRDQQMKRSPWHAINASVHHVCSNCNTGNDIENENRVSGTGGKPLCLECRDWMSKNNC